jgi:hypothetical protein
VPDFTTFGPLAIGRPGAVPSLHYTRHGLTPSEKFSSWEIPL